MGSVLWMASRRKGGGTSGGGAGRAAARLLIPPQLCARLAGNRLGDLEAAPIVRLHDPTGIGCWLLSALAGDRLYGLCDLGLGEPELGVVSHHAMTRLVGPFGHRIRIGRALHDPYPLSFWDRVAARTGSIVAAEMEVMRAGAGLALTRTEAWERGRSD